MNAAGNTSFIYRARARLRNAPARSGQHAILGGFPSAPRARLRNAKARSGKRAIRGDFIQHLARIRETRQRGVGNARFAALSFCPSRASARRASAERPTRDSRRVLQHLARIRETRQRGVGNARFAAAFFSPLRASARRASAERATCDSRRFPSAPRAHPGDAPARSRQRAICGAFFSPLRASTKRASAERATRDSRRFPSVPRAHPRDAPARSGQRAIRGAFFQPLARVRETRQCGTGNARFAAAFFSPSRASARRASAERATCDSQRLFSAPCARLRNVPARSGQRAIRGAFLQPLARVRCQHVHGLLPQPLARIRETRQRGVGNARFAAAFFSPLRASARRASAEWATRDSRRLSSAPRAHPRDAPARSGQRANRGGFFQPLARVRETRQRGVGNARFAVLSFSSSRASERRESAKRATRDSRRFPSAPRARPRDAPARSGQHAIRGDFLQPFARVRETRKRGAGNVRIAALSFSPLRASARRANAERATRESRRLSSAPRARPREAKARSGQRANRGGFLQPFARVRETCQWSTSNSSSVSVSTPRASARRAVVWKNAWRNAVVNPSRASARRASAERATRNCSGFLLPLARVRETRQRGVSNARFAAAFFSPSRASARRASAKRATLDSRRFPSAPRARLRNAKARSGKRANRGAFFQPLARVREVLQRGAGNARSAALSFCSSRASTKRESAERETCESRCFLSAPRARP